MIHPRIVASLFRKDLVDALRESRVAVSLITPILLAVLYNVMFPDERLVELKVAYAGPETSAIVRTLVARAEDSGSISLKLSHVATAEAASAAVTSRQVDAAFVLPDDVDTAIKSGASPTVTLIEPEIRGSAASFVEASIQAGARELAAQRPPATITVRNVKTGASTDQGVMGEMGPRKYFVLATIVMMLGMIAVLAVPIMLTEEVEKKTLDALLIVGSYLDVIVAKALVGLTYVAIAVAVMLALTRLRPGDMVSFVAGTSLLALALIAIGLLVGGLFKSAQQVYTWSSVMLIPVIGPAFAVGLPVPDAVDVVLKALPTSQGMRIMANGLAGERLFGDVWLSYVVTAIWAIAAYALLGWRLARRES